MQKIPLLNIDSNTKFDILALNFKALIFLIHEIKV